MAWLPAPALAAISSVLASANDVEVSTLPGVGQPVRVAGSRITRRYPFGPLPGCATVITLLSHDDVCCIGVNVDPAAVTEPAVLLQALHAGLDEVVALAGQA